MSAKRLRIIGAVAVVLLLIAALVYFLPLFKVRDFAVEGQQHTSVDEITAATGLSVGDNLMRIDALSAANGVAQLPWVDTATVTREFPGTVGVVVKERTAMLFDGSRLIDDKGEAFLEADSAPQGTIEIDAEDAVFPEAISIVGSLEEPQRMAVARMSAPSAYEFTLFTHDGKEIYWGSAENNHDKAVALKTVLQQEGNYWNISAPTLVTTR